MSDRIPNVSVYNTDARLHDTVSWEDAFSMMVRGVVHVMESHNPPVYVASPNDLFEIPSSVVLKKYAHRPPRAIDPAKASREGVLRRDKHLCAYCTHKATTWDHVLPRSRGGSDAWDNTVAACAPCNHRKADRTPEEAGMKLLWQPYVPREKDKFVYI